MKQLSGILSVGVIGLLIASCVPFQKEETPAPTSQQPQPPVSQPSPRGTAPPFAGATQAGKPSSNQITVIGLIPSTNPERRRQQVVKGRNDPFALVPVQPTFQPESQAAKAPPKPAAAAKKSPLAAKGKPQIPAVPVPPALPELAKEVVIFGVIQTDGTPQIIVKAPNEQFTRYVAPGQLIANGQVRVKRIDGLGSPAPVVVLEEWGREVYKQVGEGIPEPPASSGKAAAVFLPDWEGG